MLYLLNKSKNILPDVIIAMIQVFNFFVFALVDLRASLSFVTFYVAINFGVLLEKLLEPFSVSTHVGESILGKREYHDCVIFVNHKSTITGLV